ncbi:MAG: DUF2142 domain-containing protein [Elusimicrobiota bacterium]
MPAGTNFVWDENGHWSTAVAQMKSFLSGISYPAEFSSIYGNLVAYPGFVLSHLVIWLIQLMDISVPIYGTFHLYLARLLSGFGIAICLHRFCTLAESDHQPTWGIVSILSLFLSPLFLQRSFGLSTDIMTHALSILAVSVIFFWDRLNFFDVFLFFFFGFGTALAKPNVLLLFLSVLVYCHFIYKQEEIISTHKLFFFNLTKAQLFFWAGTLIFLLLGIQHSIYFFSHQNNVAVIAVKPNISSARQIDFILREPLFTLNIFWREFIENFSTHYFWGQSIEKKYPAVYSLFAVNLWQSIFTTAMIFEFSMIFFHISLRKIYFNFHNIFIGLLFPFVGIVLYALSIMLTAYVGWTPVGYHFVTGIQFRYFIPIFIIGLSVLFHSLSKLTKNPNSLGEEIYNASISNHLISLTIKGFCFVILVCYGLFFYLGVIGKPV